MLLLIFLFNLSTGQCRRHVLFCLEHLVGMCIVGYNSGVMKAFLCLFVIKSLIGDSVTAGVLSRSEDSDADP